ncbi:MAG: hypothetical protein WCS42_20920 [Verrucomicrobiota bacterium]
MKIKKPIKQTPLRENPPMPVTATSQGEALPPGAEYFSKLRTLSPRDFITQLCAPKLKSATDEEAKLVIECFAGMLSGLPDFYNFQVQIPEWVKTASRKYWESLGIDFNEIQKGNMAEIGKCIGLLDQSETKPPTETDSAAISFAESAKVEAAKSPAKDASQFFTGAAKGEIIREQIKVPPKRIKVFMIMSAAWRHVEQFKSAGQLHRWLEEIDAFDGSITDPAETRKICRLVGLQLRDKAGRPPKQK